MQRININKDFTTDTPCFWEGFWERKNGLGAAGNDPDFASPSLKEYHQLLWSRKLPCGDKMELKAGKGSRYLEWGDFDFGSDSLTTGFRYVRNRKVLQELQSKYDAKHGYHAYRGLVENFVRKSYTIGGMIIFPRRRGSINVMRGWNRLISDRWDLTLECIRRHYVGEWSPLSRVLEKDATFFKLFVDFPGYVDFFFLQDCVSQDYKTVKIWLGKGDFKENPLPKTAGEYQNWIEAQLEFVQLRNKRIAAFVESSKELE